MRNVRKAVPYDNSRRLELRIAAVRKKKNVSLETLSHRSGIPIERCRILDDCFGVLTLRSLWVIALSLHVGPENLLRDPKASKGFGNSVRWSRRLVVAVRSLMVGKAKAKVGAALTFVRRDCKRLESFVKRLPPPRFSGRPYDYEGPYHNLKEAYESEAEKRNSVRLLFGTTYADLGPYLAPDRDLSLPMFQKLGEVFGHLSLLQLLRAKITDGDHGIEQRATLLRLLQFLKAIIEDCKKCSVDPAVLFPFEADIVEHFGFDQDAVLRFKPSSSGERSKFGRAGENPISDDFGRR